MQLGLEFELTCWGRVFILSLGVGVRCSENG